VYSSIKFGSPHSNPCSYISGRRDARTQGLCP
jgi:hypothetical protein